MLTYAIVLVNKKLPHKIKKLKDELGGKLLLLAHHYQRPEVVALADVVGDSFRLAQEACASSAERIVLCGVVFMAEGADILTAPSQRVYMPSPDAGCPLAEMAEAGELEHLLQLLQKQGGGDVVPLCYINTNSEIKDYCGRHGGAACTSSNAERMIAWAVEGSRRALFLPDRHLGLNTWLRMGGREDETALWDHSSRRVIRGDLKTARLVLWNGYCHVHEVFSSEHVRRAEKEYPEMRLVVHPECRREVTDAAQGVGSTSFIVDFVKQAGAGRTIVVGTEQNLVCRLATEYKDRRVVELAPSPCPNMMKTTLANLAELLERWPEEKQVVVDEKYRLGTRTALERMLEISGGGEKRNRNANDDA